MNERSGMIEWIRGEVVGPGRHLSDRGIASFNQEVFADPVHKRSGPLVWRPSPDSDPEEVLYFERESPHRKYGTGLLHPESPSSATTPDGTALQEADTIGVDVEMEADGGTDESGRSGGNDAGDIADDFQIASPDVRHPSTLGISFCIGLGDAGSVIIRLPRSRTFSWQTEDSPPFYLNGRYEKCERQWLDETGRSLNAAVWRRHPAVLEGCEIAIPHGDLQHGRVIRRDVVMPAGSPIDLRIEVFPRFISTEGTWLLTVVLRNITHPGGRAHEDVLYQSYFDVSVNGGAFEKYPETQRPFESLDREEQSLALLYRESATWGIGHGCAAGWDSGPNERPSLLFSDILPAVELPSMTPDVLDAEGRSIQLSMRALASLPDEGTGSAWQPLDGLVTEYENWINRKRSESEGLGDAQYKQVARAHLDSCVECLDRIKDGVALLRSDNRVRQAFRLTNLAMLLQQIATKQIDRRVLSWDGASRLVLPRGSHASPWDIYRSSTESSRLGSWRAFQIAFLLMSLSGLRDGRTRDREIVDLIWFPTGGGKTEAYLGAMAFYMFHERIRINDEHEVLRRDGTNVLMRYTLRMLTTQQFQRGASLICAMDFLRRNAGAAGDDAAAIRGGRFSVGLWIGGQGSPNNIRNAESELNEFRRDDGPRGNPLVLTECPWCRSQIGRYDGPRPNGLSQAQWNQKRTRGIQVVPNEGPLLQCPDSACEFGQEHHEDWLPVEVIDERIYRHPPSLVIGTADKLAMVAYRPDAGALFGTNVTGGNAQRHSYPPGMIIQDELHLISGPLGTMYSLYEGIFERLCSYEQNGVLIKPKLIASTATIRGAEDQVKALYARTTTSLFPSPGLEMGDSFFGTYARDESGRLQKGRLYLGIHASEFGSVLTTQVRAFSSALFRPFSFSPESRDPWWTLLVFYNSLRELGGAKTLFDSDIRSRLKFMFNREGFPHNSRRNIRIVEELTSRLSQAEIVGMMDKLSTQYDPTGRADVFDACLASNIIEVGVDIDRLSLMGVVGQPKTTATYIQVTGRVGRRWWERPGLILMLYNPGKSRDRSHFEQFHSYHRRLYERVEPTSATPFALSAIQRALPGALITWARQQSDAPVQNAAAYRGAIDDAYELLRERCLTVQSQADMQRSLDELERVRNALINKWNQNPQEWEKFPQRTDGEYLMLWPGQFATDIQKRKGEEVPTSMRQVDRSAELAIDQGYATTP